MIEPEGALAGHGFDHGYAGCAGEARESVRGLAVNDAPTRNDERSLRRPEQRRRLLQQNAVGARACDGPDSLAEQRLRIVERFGLNDLNDLPKIEDMAQQLGFDPPPVLMERAIPEEMLPLEEGDVPDDQPE